MRLALDHPGLGSEGHCGPARAHRNQDQVQFARFTEPAGAMHIGYASHDVSTFGVEHFPINLNGFFQGCVEGISDLILFTAEFVDHANFDHRTGGNSRSILPQGGQSQATKQNEQRNYACKRAVFVVHLSSPVVKILSVQANYYL